MKSLRYVILFVLLVVLAAPVEVSRAATVTGTPLVTCTGIVANGATVTTNRNNTGDTPPRERLRLIGVDGLGNIIYDTGGDFVFATYGFGSGTWITPPKANPLRLTLISAAGNSFTEQIVGSWTGECELLNFRGPGLPGGKNLVLFLSDVPILSDANGSPTGLVMKTCKTAFVIGEKNGFARLFMMGGWVPVSSYVDVPEEYGQKGFPVVPQCVGK